VTALGPAAVGELVPESDTGTAEEALTATRKVHFAEAGGWIETAIYDRGRLKAGARFDGPAILEQADSTVVVPPGARAEVDEYRNVIIDVRGMLRV
jgi:N-methylhydantoinase A